MIAVIALRPDGSRAFRLATEQGVAVAQWASGELARRQVRRPGSLPLVPGEPTPEVRGPGATRQCSIAIWGMTAWQHLFTPRQALALSTFVRLV